MLNGEERFALWQIRVCRGGIILQPQAKNAWVRLLPSEAAPSGPPAASAPACVDGDSFTSAPEKLS